jgi:HEAT repeat protein
MNPMKRLFVITFLSFMSVCAIAQEAPEVPSNSFLPQQSAQAAREDELYKDGTDYINEGKWDQAADKFKQVAEMKGRRVDAALYWKAYAQHKMGSDSYALSTLNQLRTQYPKSTWLKDAGALEVEIKNRTGQQVNPANESDEDLKVYAINSLMNSDPERALPILENILKDPKYSSRLKERALFVLAQSDSAKSQEIVLNVAKGQSGPELQTRAIRMIGVSGERYVPALTQIYTSSTDPRVKGAVLNAYLTSGAKQELLKAIGTEKDPEMRRKAIRQLGPMGASKELEQLYGSTQSPEDQEAIIQALAITGDTSLLSKIAKTGANVDVRRRAIRSLGITGDRSHAVLLDIFNTDSNPEIRKSVTDALFVSGGCAEMVTLARKETDNDVKKSLINKISLMNCKEGRDYMMELLK